MSDTVQYFGYGANREPSMMAAILGKPESELVGRPAVLQGHELGVQRLVDVPDVVSPSSPVQISPRALLAQNWGEDFQSYGIRQNPDAKVAGVIWELTHDERERIRDWELIDFGWFEDYSATAQTDDGEEVVVIGERLGSGQTVDHLVDGLDYPSWLQDPREFKLVAERARQEYDERLRGPEGGARHPDIKNS